MILFADYCCYWSNPENFVDGSATMTSTSMTNVGNERCSPTVELLYFVLTSTKKYRFSFYNAFFCVNYFVFRLNS